MQFYAKSPLYINILKLFYFFAEPKELLHQAVVIKTLLLTQWNDTRIMCVTNARRLIMVVRHVAMRN